MAKELSMTPAAIYMRKRRAEKPHRYYTPVSPPTEAEIVARRESAGPRRRSRAKRYYAANLEKCRNYVRVRRAKDPEKEHANARERYKRLPAQKHKAHCLKSKYGLSISEFQGMLEKQRGCCQICNMEFAEIDNNTRPCVDHNHDTGAVRGLLCRKCTLALGHFADNLTNLKSAITYLEESTCQDTSPPCTTSGISPTAPYALFPHTVFEGPPEPFVLTTVCPLGCILG